MENEKLVSYTWLPVFPGFYSTIFDIEGLYEYEIDGIYEKIEPEELAKCMAENLYHSKASDKFVAEYKESVSKQSTGFIEDQLKRLGYVESIEYEEIHSPREYNFYNDTINIKVIFSAENVEKIKIMLKEHADEWKEYLKSHYTSCSGFISLHSPYPEAKEWNIDNALQDTHNAGAILQFLCEQDNITDELLYDFTENNVSVDLDLLKKECIEQGWYKPKNICLDWFKSFWYRKRKYKFKMNRYSSALEFVLCTPKQKYIFAISRQEIKNDCFTIKRLFQIFIFAKLKEEKKHGNKNNN